MKTYKELIDYISDRLKPAYADAQERRQVAWWMLEALTELNKTALITRQHQLTQAQKEKLDAWIDEQVEHQKPLQYLIGSVPFLDLSISIEPPIAIPRPETEFWLDKLIHMLEPVKNEPLKILDLCTGSGCIALGIAQAFTSAEVTGVDINERALEIARLNQKNNSITNTEFIFSDLFTNLHDKTFDLIISNPPYVSPAEWEEVHPRVRNWEDERAMRAEEEGYAIIRSIIDQAPTYLNSNSVLIQNELPQIVLEIGYQQGPRVKELLGERGYNNIQIWHDQYGNVRVAIGSY